MRPLLALRRETRAQTEARVAREWTGCEPWDQKEEPMTASVKRGPRPRAPEERFWQKVERQNSACWIWTGFVGKDGYGRFNAGNNHPMLAHRFSYEKTVGAVPVGLELDHVCRNRRCVNPSHLEPVTRSENLRRGYRASPHPQRVICPNGHPYEQPRIGPGKGKRRCPICARASWQRSNRRRRP